MSATDDVRVIDDHTEPAAGDGAAMAGREIALVDLLDRLLAGGVVVTGDLTLTIADVDLVHISLRALISSVREGEARAW